MEQPQIGHPNEKTTQCLMHLNALSLTLLTELADGLEFERKARFDITDSSERMAAFQKVRD
jgi:hypothetical protein